MYRYKVLQGYRFFQSSKDFIRDKGVVVGVEFV